jgi:hypothetical protein
VVVAFVPRGTSVEQLAELGLSPGLMSAGLGSVPAEQTYLDITQGNRVFDSLYDTDLPPLGHDCSAWPAVIRRADSAPADIVPGLLATQLLRGGVKVRGDSRTPCPLTHPHTSGDSGDVPGDSGDVRELDPRYGGSNSQTSEVGGEFGIRVGGLEAVRRLARGLRGGDLLIAIEEPPPDDGRQLAIGLAGPGFEPGDLTSDSTRTDGYVLSTDLAPTILERFGLPVPSEMSGQPIATGGVVDPGAVEELGDRMAVIPGRRGPVIGLALLAWVVALAATATLGRSQGLARPATRLVALSVVYLPSTLLIGAALQASLGVEQLLVILGSPLLAALTARGLGGYRALGFASAVTVTAYALDVIAGSSLTALSLLGPNPGLGVRFYGIGNELEALLAVLLVAGTGAALSGFAPRASPRRAAVLFLLAGLGGAFVFAAGRFGADVGAAIVFPLGAAVAAATAAARSRSAVLAVAAVPVLALAALALVDLSSGADAHLTRSVLDAGGLDQLGDVAQRRLELSAHSFARPIVFVFLPLIALAAALAIARRERISAWLRPAPYVRAGLAGALAATILGTLANDSGALLLEIGSAFLLVFLGYAWAEATDGPGRYP